VAKSFKAPRLSRDKRKPAAGSILKPNRYFVVERAVTFLLVVCLTLLTVDGVRSWNARAVQLQEMDAATSNLAQAMAQHANDSFKLADAVVFGAVDRMESTDTSAVGLQKIHQFLMASLIQMPQFTGIYISNETGRWIVDSELNFPSRINISDRDYFIFHRTHTDLGVHIGVPILGRLKHKWILPISRRINYPDGGFAGVACVTIDLDYFTQFYNKLNIGHAGSLMLALNSGAVLVRRPSDTMSGRSLIGTNLFHAVMAGGGFGSLLIKSSVDGVTRLNSYRILDNYPLFVDAAFSKNEILSGWWHDTVLHSTGVFILVMILVAAGVRLIKQIALRIKTEQELILARDALKELNQTLEKLAHQDGLTGLANRRKFDLSLNEEFCRATRNASSLSLILIDVDLFKKYNDIYGHLAGDECLRTISQTIRSLAQHRPGDLVARYGGEELAVLLPNTDVVGAFIVAEKIRKTIQQLEIEHSGNPIGMVTISAGIGSQVPMHEAGTPNDLLDSADKALYAAKSAGRNLSVKANRLTLCEINK